MHMTRYSTATNVKTVAFLKFELAIKDFLRREKTGIDQYTNELNERAPYKTELNI